MNRMGAHLLYNERVQTRVVQAVGRCTRGLNDFSAVVVSGEELTDYLTNQKRRKYFHPEMQAEITFGVEQSTKIDLEELEENFKIFLRHDDEWEEANEQIIDHRSEAVQEAFPSMESLAKSVEHEVLYQQAMWRGDYPSAFDHARDVIAAITGDQLRGYRALWHYLAGSAADMATAEQQAQMTEHARGQFRAAKEYASGIPWLSALASHRAQTTEKEDSNPTTLLQIEALEAYFSQLGVTHNRNFAERERLIREGLAGADDFEAAQVLLGEHLGFTAGKRETDAAPDPWWLIGDVCIVFEDHAGAAPLAFVDAKKARQAASHPAWVKEKLPAAAEANVRSVLVTPTRSAKDGAIPSLRSVGYWNLELFRTWAEQALISIRDIRRTFVEPGDLSWRAQAISALEASGTDAPGLFDQLSKSSAADEMTVIP